MNSSTERAFDWLEEVLVREVTDEKRYTNRSLAR
jgi:CYTH domain-containing protein